MITEAVLTTVVTGILYIVGQVWNAMLGALQVPTYQFGIPLPMWPIITSYVQGAVQVYPLALTWFLWRQVKS